MKYWMFLGLFTSALVFGTTYPVDEAIAELRFKANSLEQLKQFYLTNRCTIQVGSNEIQLKASDLRSNGLVIGIADSSPGSTYPFEKAPQPQFLERVLNQAGVEGGWVISSQFAYLPGSSSPSHLVVALNQPFFESGLWLYRKTTFSGPVPTPAKMIDVAKVTSGGVNVRLRCN